MRIYEEQNIAPKDDLTLSHRGNKSPRSWSADRIKKSWIHYNRDEQAAGTEIASAGPVCSTKPATLLKNGDFITDHDIRQ